MATKKTPGDARLREDLVRGDRAGRAPRGEVENAEREVSELMSDAELRASIRSEFTQEALPAIKAPPGWHYCWLINGSSYDPIQKRMRIGYQPVTYSELVDMGYKNFDQYKVTGGDFDGMVSCNEMLLFKITQERYQVIMSEFHHYMPLEEEKAIRERVESAAVEDRTGKKLLTIDKEDEGLKDLGKEPALSPFV
jgi:hypothetical protein